MEYSLYETCNITVSFGITVETITILYKFQQKIYIYMLITHLTKALICNYNFILHVKKNNICIKTFYIPYMKSTRKKQCSFFFRPKVTKLLEVSWILKEKPNQTCPSVKGHEITIKLLGC